MEREGVVHALRRTHEALVDEGLLLDVHPVPPSARVEATGAVIGRLRERAFFVTVRETERELEQVVRDGLFAHVRRLEHDIVDRFDSADELVAEVDEWDEAEVPHTLRRRLARTSGPVDLVNRVTFRLLRRI